MNLNSILIGSENPAGLVEYYTKLFGDPGMVENGYSGWKIGEGYLTVGPHDEVHGMNAEPGRILWNIETADVESEFARLQAAGATAAHEPYHPGEDSKFTIATFSDPDGNLFQLMSPM